MNYKKSRASGIIYSIARYIFLLAFSYILLYPLIFMITNAFKSSTDFYDPTIEWVPKNPTLSNFTLAIKAMDFGIALKDTLIYEIVAAALEIVSCGIAAYGLARFEFRGKKLLNAVMILTILVPTAMIIIPSYLNFRYLDFLGVLSLVGKAIGKDIRVNVLDTPLVMWLPSILAVGLKGGLFIYIYKQFFQGLPKEFEEAAYIDGAGPVRTFLSVIVPSSTVSIVTVTMFAVVWHWNDYYLANMYLSDNAPLSVRLARIDSLISTAIYGDAAANVVLAPTIVAACLLTVMPLILFYVVLQRRFIASIASSGIVG